MANGKSRANKMELAVRRIKHVNKTRCRSWGFYYEERASPVYSKKEADDASLEYVYWRDLVFDIPEPALVLTDDDKVVELVSVYRSRWLKRKERYGTVLVRTCHQTVHVDAGGKNRLTTEQAQSFVQLGGYRRGKRTKITTKKQEKFCELVAHGITPKYAYMTAHFPTSGLQSRLGSQVLLTRPNIMEKINEIAKALKGKGFSYTDYVCNLIELAKEDNKVGVDSVKDIGSLTGWDGNSIAVNQALADALAQEGFTVDDWVQLIVDKIGSEEKGVKRNINNYAGRVAKFDKNAAVHYKGGKSGGLIAIFGEESHSKAG